jgi:hypothetical protein
MRARTKAKLLALLITSTLFSLTLNVVVYSYAVSRGAMGKEAYLQHEARLFDRLLAKPQRLFTAHSFVAYAYVGACFGAFIGIYECVALGIYKIIGPDKTERDETPAT